MNSLKYKHYDPQDFVTDEFFIDWCIHENEDAMRFWEQWLKEHPHKKEEVLEAKRLVSQIRQGQMMDAPSGMKLEIWNSINDQILKDKAVQKAKDQPYVLFKRFFAVAASFILFYFLFNFWSTDPEAIEWTKYANHSEIMEKYELEDGSMVHLSPNSSIQFSSLYDVERREIVLEGDAFFDVARDTSKAFLVYANKTITKVLGTSFWVKASKHQKTVEVEVETGSVEVLANLDKKGTGKSQTIFKKGSIEIPKPDFKVNLTPNEKVSFDDSQKNMIKSIVSKPKLLKLNNSDKVQFDNEPVSEIFQALENAYGIDLEFDKKKLSSCSISTVLDDSPLFTKMDIICTALELQYEERNAIIYISGNACK